MKAPERAAQWDIIESNRMARVGAVLQTYKISAVWKTMNNSLWLLKTFIRQQNAGGGALSYQSWQYGVFPCGNPQTWERWVELFWLHTSFLFMADTETIH